MKNVLGAVCTLCGAEHEAGPETTVCPKCGGILEIKYDYKYAAKNISREKLATSRDASMWRYRALLPVGGDWELPGLRAGGSPIYESAHLASELGLGRLWIKDDGVNPTASLKDRASAMAVVRAIAAGQRVVACSSTGNAASSLAGAAAACGLESRIFVPERAPKGKVAQLLMFGATVVSVRGNYEQTFALSAEAIARWGWYDRNAAINPYLSEGKKTVSYEIAEQLCWRVPDYVALSVGDGCTIAGVWKGFKDLYAAGLTDRLPRLISVQASGCCPVNNAYAGGYDKLVPMEENTIADSIAVGVPRNFTKALRALRESDAVAVNVSDGEILEAMKLLGQRAGVFGEPAGVTGTAGLKKACEQGLIPAGAEVCAIVTGNGLKDIANAMTAAGEPISCAPDMRELEKKLKI